MDSSSDEEDCSVYSRVKEALAANRLKAAKENAARRQIKEVDLTTSSAKPERKKKRKDIANRHDDDEDTISILPEQKDDSLSLVTAYGFYEGKNHFLSFNISRTEPLNVLKNYLAQQLHAPACSVRLRLHDKLVSGQESLEQIEAAKTDCIEFEIDELVKEAMLNTFKLKFVLQKRAPVILAVDKTAEFSAIIGKLCEHFKTDSSNLAVFFDGDRISETDTPSSLDMESGDAVDVIIKE
ncbi:Rad60-SLD domain containing protein [Trichuris trichiura]|uniref:Rad60-SLD domain containing protein n=1 Tax=Trichuris trichiura TaxID=36087 RepID=A0A077Z701_TRITR|nr:Rad60-SLD domain containing protein [Trichuris trichiura]